jgi:hypothetical protein
MITHSYHLIAEGKIIGKSNCGKTTLLLNLLLQPFWLDYKRLHVFGNTLYQKECEIWKKGLKSGLSKEQIANIFLNQNDVEKYKLLPIEVIEQYSGIAKDAL